jgi:hypothetical protein
MTAKPSETATHDHYLAEANAELDAMLGEVGEVDATPPPPAEAGRGWMRWLVIAVIAIAVFVIGMVLLRGRRPTRMALNLVR